MNVEVICPHCGSPFGVPPYRLTVAATVCCSRKCSYAYRRLPVAARFWRHVNKDGPLPAHLPHLGPCWLWTSGRHDFGYGKLAHAGQGQPPQLAHRVSWELHYGAIPAEMYVCHKCDTPLCVRPDHLFLDTNAGNVRDMWQKGRAARKAPRGEQSPHAKLTAAQVEEIRARVAAGGVSNWALSKEYGVSAGLIGHLVRGRAWKHV